MVMMVMGLHAASFAQYTGATAKLESNRIVIGDQVKVELQLSVPAGSRVQWPMLLDTLTRNVEILRKSSIDTVSSDKELFTLKQELLLTSFDSGYYVIQPIIFKYSQKGDTITYFTETAPLYLEVQNVKVDQAADIKPIKPPLKAPLTFREMLPWIALLLLVTAIIAGVWYYLKKKKQVKPILTTRLKPSIPPYEAAMEAMENLRLKKLWQSGRVKDYYSELTEIVREYIELRFRVRALEMTSSEIHEALRFTDAHSGAREKLNQVLMLADLVKFAKVQPLPLDNDNSFNQCVDFLKETRPPKESLVAEQENRKTIEQEK
jgi:hypothetical protein